ncbi:MAG: hypothetical protein CTR53_15370 [Ferrovibrio sp.]|nr:MAG: hypothetical protein CTR53_15370 [Ferrovibrio sp.]
MLFAAAAGHPRKHILQIDRLAPAGAEIEAVFQPLQMLIHVAHRAGHIMRGEPVEQRAVLFMAAQAAARHFIDRDDQRGARDQRAQEHE